MSRWPFDEATGLVVNDATGHGNAGTAQNGMGWTYGRVGSAGWFDGSNDQVAISDSPSLQQPTSAITIAAWVYPTKTTGYRTIVHKDGQYSFALYYGRLRYADSVAWSYSQNGSYGTVPLNTWTHVAVTFDGTMLRFYVDGAEVGSKSRPGTLTPSTAPACLAANRCKGSRLAGGLDEVVVYDRALSKAEISALCLAATSGDASTTSSP